MNGILWLVFVEWIAKPFWHALWHLTLERLMKGIRDDRPLPWWFYGGCVSCFFAALVDGAKAVGTTSIGLGFSAAVQAQIYDFSGYMATGAIFIATIILVSYLISAFRRVAVESAVPANPNLEANDSTVVDGIAAVLNSIVDRRRSDIVEDFLDAIEGRDIRAVGMQLVEIGLPYVLPLLAALLKRYMARLRTRR